MPTPNRTTPPTGGGGAGQRPGRGDKGGKGDRDGGKDKINQDQIEEDYGLSYALFQAFPELKALLKKAVAESWTPQKFQVELRQTKWFAKHSDVWREVTALHYSDPATYEERYQNTLTQVSTLAAALSSRISPEGLAKLAKRALLFGMDETQISDQLARYVKPSAEGYYTGELSAIEQTLRATALQNGVGISDAQLQKWMRAIVRGDASEDQFQTSIRTMAAQMFPMYGEQIRGGMDLVDVATPYIQSMSTLLELNPGAIDLNDPTIRRALAGTKDAQGKVSTTLISEFEDSLRNDPRWMNTRNARTTAEGFAASIGKMWGLV